MGQTPPRTLLQQLIRQLEVSYEQAARQLNPDRPTSLIG
jgi:hypothetical protein